MHLVQIIKTTMLRNCIILFFSTYLLFACNSSTKEEAPNYSEKLTNQLTSAVLWFQKSAEMEAVFVQTYHYAKMVLAQKLDTLSEQNLRPAIILDLDETVLDNSAYEVRLIQTGEGYNSKSWENWCNEAKAIALPGAIDFLRFADSLGVEIFYISNRKEAVFESTLENLKSLEIPQADSARLMLRTSSSDKTERRNAVTEQYQVLLYIGDNLTDYSEEYASRGADLGKQHVLNNKEELLKNFIMLPNPMYGEWEAAIYDNDFSKSDEEKLKARREILESAK